MPNPTLPPDVPCPDCPYIHRAESAIRGGADPTAIWRQTALALSKCNAEMKATALRALERSAGPVIWAPAMYEDGTAAGAFWPRFWLLSFCAVLVWLLIVALGGGK